MNESTGRREIEALIQGYLEGSLTEDESRRLLASLRRDSSLVTAILENLRTDCLIRAVLAEAPGEIEKVGRVTPCAPQVPERFSIYDGARGVTRPTARKRWPQVLALAACLALLAGLSVWFSGAAMGEPVLAGIQGVDVSIERGTEFIPAANGMRLQSADVLRVGTNGTATIAFGREHTRIDLRPSSELKLASWSHGKRFELRGGNIEATVAPQRLFQPMTVTTPNAEARVMGTRFTLTATTNRTRLDVTDGRVRLTRASDDAAVKVGAGYYAIAATNVVLSSLPQTGTILREYWTNIPGTDDGTLLTKDSRFPDHPDGTALLTRLEVSPNWGDNFGDRICGYLHPPTTGSYAFFISGDGGSRLWLSRDDDPENKMPIAWAEENDTGEWTKSQSQQSVPLTLTAGKRYYIEVLRHCGTGPDHLAVAWQPPGGRIEVIPGEFLSPFKPKK